MQTLVNYWDHYIRAPIRSFYYWLKDFYLWLTFSKLVFIPPKEGEPVYPPYNHIRWEYPRARELREFLYKCYVWLRPRIKSRLKRIWAFVWTRGIYGIFIKPIEFTIKMFWAFWGWKGLFWSWDFWYNQYCTVRVWIGPAVAEHQREFDEMFKKLVLFEWQYQVKEQTLDAFYGIYFIPMRPDSFSDFILMGVIIFLLPTSLYFTDLEGVEILQNIINTILQIAWIIIITRMVVTVFWSHHLTMYIMFHPICFSLLLLSRSFANDILLDDESIVDVVCVWCGLFFLTTVLWSIDMFFVH